jgi:cytochrome c
MYNFPERVSVGILWMLLAFAMSGCSPDGGDMPATDDSSTINPLANYEGKHIGYYGYGSPASTEEIAGWDIDIRPDGQGLPQGSGSVEDGEWLYEDKCAECHGSFGEGSGRHPVLAGGQGSLSEARPTKTVGSYWPYTSTLFDYIRRAMPFAQPQSLSADETYAITAYVLYLNDLVEDDFVLNRDNLPGVHLPNEGNFVPDPRPDVTNQRCMENCRDPASIEITSEVSPVAGEQASQIGEMASEEASLNSPGEQVYQQYCSICHDVGVAGAPITGDAPSWESRVEQGFDVLVSHAINGTESDAGTMPPKGGFAQLTDDEVAQAVRHMVENSQ